MRSERKALQVLLYIAGAGRSGSTLLEMSLGTGPAYFSVGEVRYFWQYIDDGRIRCGCGALLQECEFWTRVLARLEGIQIQHTATLANDIDRTRNVLSLSMPRHYANTSTRKLVARTGELYRAIGDECGAPVIVDSSKVPSHLALLRRVPDIDVRILHLVRDGRAVAYSWSRRTKDELARTEPGTKMPRRSALSALGVWAVENTSVLHLSRGLPYTVLRYEDFVRDPLGALTSALTSLHLPTSDMDFLREAGQISLKPSHSVGGNPLRFLGKQIEIKADEVWRREYGLVERMGMGLLAMPWLRHFRYKLN